MAGNFANMPMRPTAPGFGEGKGAPEDMGLQEVIGTPEPGIKEEGRPAQQEQQQLMARVRDLRQSVEALARQYPIAANDWRTVQQAIISAMNKVAASLNKPEPEAPKI
jgi:hypothetical protein